jgi:hypothetical protein
MLCRPPAAGPLYPASFLARGPVRGVAKGERHSAEAMWPRSADRVRRASPFLAPGPVRGVAKGERHSTEAMWPRPNRRRHPAAPSSPPAGGA